MRYVQINSFYNGSTGAIMRGLHRELSEQGEDSYIFWGRRHKTIDDREWCFATKLGYLWHGGMVRLFGHSGFYSKRDTERLLRRLDEIDPDVVHLHNLHGYYANVEMLFGWLSQHRCQVRWTLHDCWAFTGHCIYFTMVKCMQWQSHCIYKGKCPQVREYPKTIAGSRVVGEDFDRKKAAFTSLSPDRMTLVTPSKWLAELVGRSFLSKYPVEVIPNKIDKTVFKPTPSDFREHHGIGNRFMVLGVASPWAERKGLGDFVKLAGELDPERFAIVLVGLSRRQIRKLPKGIVGLERTSSPKELAAIYTAADIFFNPTWEDNYPTVNLEAEACGTPVLTRDVGGCKETVFSSESCVYRSFEQVVPLIEGRAGK